MEDGVLDHHLQPLHQDQEKKIDLHDLAGMGGEVESDSNEIDEILQ